MKGLIFSIFLSLASLAFAADVQQVYGQCIKVADGDTITVVDKEGNKHKVRFYGIDAPEKEQEWGQQSRKTLADVIDQKQVRLEVINTDRYSRKVSKVFLIEGNKEIYINSYMVNTGNAWYYEQYAKNDAELAAAHQKAKSEKLGLWSAKNPIAPWLYRSGISSAKNTVVHKAGTEWFWVSSTGKVHNSTCVKYYAQGNGEMTMTPKGENCKVCGGCSD